MAQVVINFTGDPEKLMSALNRIADKEREVGESRKSYGRESVDLADQMEKKMLSWAVGLASVSTAVNLARSVYQGWMEDMKKGGEQIAKQFADVQALQFFQGGDPAARARMQGVSERWGLPVADVARARLGLETTMMGAAPERLEGVFQQTLAHARASGAPAGELAGAYSRLSQVAPELSPAQIGNIMSKMPPEAAEGVAKAIGAGRIGHMTPAEVAGLVQAVAPVTGGAKAGQAAADLIEKMMSPEATSMGLIGTARERMERLGGRLGGGMALDIPLGGAAPGPTSRLGGYSEAEAAKLMGDTKLLPVIQRPDLYGAVEGFAGEVRGGDLVGDRIRRMRETDPAFVATEEKGRAKARADVSAAGAARPDIELAVSALDTAMERRGINKVGRGMARGLFQLGTFLGGDPQMMLESSAAEGGLLSEPSRAALQDLQPALRRIEAAVLGQTRELRHPTLGGPDEDK